MTARRARILAAVVVIAALLAGAYAARSLFFGSAATTTSASLVDARIGVLINQRRARAGLAPLRVDAALEQLAEGHSRDMIDNAYFAHDSPGGLTFAQRVTRLHRSTTAENIAWGTGGFGTASGIVSLWMASPEHRRIILTRSLRRIGVGIVIGTFEGQHHATVATADFSS